jgi:predicted oxidoreductase (fatty acid repression mutant protein)
LTTQARRSYYALTPKSTLSDAELEALVKRAVKFTPTSFNMQHTRAVLVTGEMNQKVWDTIKEIKTKDETGMSLLPRRGEGRQVC